MISEPLIQFSKTEHRFSTISRVALSRFCILPLDFFRSQFLFSDLCSKQKTSRSPKSPPPSPIRFHITLHVHVTSQDPKPFLANNVQSTFGL